MKTQKYLVTIEMPDGDMVSPGWIQELIQADCDVENDGRQKVSVEEIKAEESLGKTLDEAAHEYECTKSPYGANAFKVGAKWMAGQLEEVLLIMAEKGLTPYKDGNAWSILLGNNLQEGVSGFGDTITEAMMDFLKDAIVQSIVKVTK